LVCGFSYEKLNLEEEKCTLASALSTSMAWERPHPAASTIAHRTSADPIDQEEKEVHQMQHSGQRCNSGPAPRSTHAKESNQQECASCGNQHDRKNLQLQGHCLPELQPGPAAPRGPKP
ncbi:UNVERIFIED_CONTAM: hypothetical protein K2H54_074774, partial [Gekko kuhli]